MRARREVGGIERQGGLREGRNERAAGRDGEAERPYFSGPCLEHMYVHPHARVCVRARANVNVYHEAHL